MNRRTRISPIARIEFLVFFDLIKRSEGKFRIFFTGFSYKVSQSQDRCGFNGLFGRFILNKSAEPVAISI